MLVREILHRLGNQRQVRIVHPRMSCATACRRPFHVPGLVNVYKAAQTSSINKPVLISLIDFWERSKHATCQAFLKCYKLLMPNDLCLITPDLRRSFSRPAIPLVGYLSCGSGIDLWAIRAPFETDPIDRNVDVRALRRDTGLNLQAE